MNGTVNATALAAQASSQTCEPCMKKAAWAWIAAIFVVGLLWAAFYGHQSGEEHAEEKLALKSKDMTLEEVYLELQALRHKYRCSNPNKSSGQV
jgi:hypothetical protein